MCPPLRRPILSVIVALMVIALPIVGRAGQGQPTQAPAPGQTAGRGRGGAVPPSPALGAGPWFYDTYEQNTRIRVSVVTKGLVRPWSLAFLPNGDMLVTERPGRLRIVRNGKLDPAPISGLPQDMFVVYLAGLMDIALHPRFADNHLVYFTYSKSGEKGGTTVLGRGRLEGNALVEVRDLFVSDAWATGGGDNGSRIVFGRDGMIYMTIGDRADPKRAQETTQHAGTVVRLRDDGSVPADNPFVGKPGFRPEIYTYGHRSQEGLAVNPTTGEIWETEHGPQGGDELNILQAGRNYGWPIVTFGHNYDGTNLAEKPWREGLQGPWLFWVPSIATSGLAFYTGDRLSAWRGNVFVGGMVTARIRGTGHLERIVFNEKGELRRESLLTDLHQRIRDVRQGPDGCLYLLTDEDAGALLKIEPAPPSENP